MTKYIKGKDGKFAGSIGDGKTSAPVAMQAPIAPQSNVVADFRAAQAEDLSALYGRFKAAAPAEQKLEVSVVDGDAGKPVTIVRSNLAEGTVKQADNGDFTVAVTSATNTTSTKNATGVFRSYQEAVDFAEEAAAFGW